MAELQREETQFLKTLVKGEERIGIALQVIKQSASLLQKELEKNSELSSAIGDLCARSSPSAFKAISKSALFSEKLGVVAEKQESVVNASQDLQDAVKKLSDLLSKTDLLLKIAESLKPMLQELKQAPKWLPSQFVQDFLVKNTEFFAAVDARKPFETVPGNLPSLFGTYAFTLYDTYGFPLELTQEIAAEQGISVDVEGFEVEMEKQRDRARKAHKSIDLLAQESIEQLAQSLEATEFLGYTDLQSRALIKALLVESTPVERAEVGSAVQIILEQTPFYAESGGQIGDRGYLSGKDLLVQIDDVQKEGNVFIHTGQVERGTLQTESMVNATIDRACRRRVQANHSATHLLQAALKLIVDESISQAGSLVAFDRFRFDFNLNRAVTSEELAQVEAQINTWVAESHLAEIAVMPIDQAKAKGATAMFGEKYGDEVRVIDFPGVSMELCGGTHVHNTAEIGAVKIISEAGISSGVRRIEAVAGPAILDYLQVRDGIVKDLSDRFKAQPEEILERVTKLQAELKATQKALDAAKNELALAKSDQLLAEAETVGDFKVLVANLGDLDPKVLQTAAERLGQKLGESAVVLASTPAEGKVSLVAAFSPQVIKAKGLKAGQFIGAIAKRCGGGGGGRPNLAQAGGRDASQLPEALSAAREALTEALQASQ
ncbi:MAG: alanine--tRNA ligase [Spirulina sp. SIO3F2]|nr:alanine--tRNA ligase [Spirulina sp. SIO3F2]